MHSLVPELFPAKLSFSIPGDPPEWKNSAFLVAIFCVLLVTKTCVVLFTDYTDELSELQDCILDGEIVVLDEAGKPDFNLLQNYRGRGNIVYYVFDLLYLEGESYLDRPLLQRKEMLLHIVKKEQYLAFSDDFPSGVALFEEIKKLDLEGIVAKRKDSLYFPGARSKNWLKIKISSRREFVIGGWSENDNNTSFRSILFGEYVENKLEYVHHSGGGYTNKEKDNLYVRFKSLEIKRCPFGNQDEIDITGICHWVKPLLIGEFEISNKVTKAGLIRHPAIFKGLRDDKKPKDVMPEIAISPANIHAALMAEIYSARKKNSSPQIMEKNDMSNIAGSWETLDKIKITSEEPFEVDGQIINLTNIERHVWKDVTKADLIQYNISVSDYMLPFLKDRALGINISLYDPADSFFIRGMEGRAPKWATVFETERKHKKAGKSDKIEWLICNDLKTLVYITNLNCIDVHPWASRRSTYNNPDYITIDLDPSDNDFNKVIETARAAKELFDKMKLTTFIKTSGKTGMHIIIPCNGIQYGQARIIAENICLRVHELVPSITTTSTSINSRGDLLYVDPSQNDYGDRIAAPYCARAYHVPTVSSPLEWKEIKAGLDPTEFDIHTIGNRLEKKGDLWKDVLNKRFAAENSKKLKEILTDK